MNLLHLLERIIERWLGFNIVTNHNSPKRWPIVRLTQRFTVLAGRLVAGDPVQDLIVFRIALIRRVMACSRAVYF